MMNTETTCQGWRCEAPATTHRTKVNGQRFDCCADHAANFDAVSARNAAMTPELIAEARAEQALESRVS